MSPPNHMSLRLDDSSKYALTWTGRPVLTGSGRKQKARPSSRKDSMNCSGDSSGCGTLAATPTHGTKPRLTPVSDSANARAFPPASELHTIHRSRVTDVPTMTLFVDPNPSGSSSPINSSAGSDDETRIWRSIQPTDVGSDLSGIVRSFSTNCCFLTAATGATPRTTAELPATH